MVKSRLTTLILAASAFLLSLLLGSCLFWGMSDDRIVAEYDLGYNHFAGIMVGNHLVTVGFVEDPLDSTATLIVLRTIDISDPLHPEAAANLQLGSGNYIDNVKTKIITADNLVILSFRDDNEMLDIRDIFFCDVSDPDQPSLRGRISMDLPDSSNPGIPLLVSGNHLYTTKAVYDITSVDSPDLLEESSWTAAFRDDIDAAVGAINVESRLFVLSTPGQSVLSVYEANDPPADPTVTELVVGGERRPEARLAVIDDYVYIAGVDDKLTVVDSSTSPLRIVGSHFAEKNVSSLFTISDDFLLLSSNTFMHYSVSIADRENPAITAGPYMLGVFGDANPNQSTVAHSNGYLYTESGYWTTSMIIRPPGL